MKQYELLLILNPELSDAEEKDIVEEVRSWIGEGGGEVEAEESWGKRKLAYEIEDQGEGRFIILSFSGPSEVSSEIQKRTRRKEEILRTLLVRND